MDSYKEIFDHCIYREGQACVRVNGKFSRWFPISQGVQEGCVMSPLLFNIYIDGIDREAMEGIVWVYNYLT